MAKAKSKAADKKPMPTTEEEKAKALAAALDKINKDFGKGTIMKLGENQHMEISAVSTGSLNLDLALGVGGLPRGRITEIYGPESSGKTTLALHCVAQVQKAGGSAAFIDAEHALDPVYAKKLGVNIDDLLVSQPDSGEQALSVAEMLLRSGAVDIIVVDSVAALVPQAEIDGDIGASMVGVHARLMSSAMRRLSGVIERSGTVFIFINQLREKVGVVYGNPEVTTGGRALKFYASVRIEVRRGEALKRGTEQYGSRTKCKVVKNKVAPPFKTAEFDMLFGQGISYVGEVLDLGVALEFVEKSGAWFSLDGERIGQGREKARDWLAEHPDKLEELAEKIRANAANIDLSLDENDLGEAGVDTEDDGFDISAELSALDLK